VKKTILFLLTLLAVWGILTGCERSALPAQATPGPLPTPRIASAAMTTPTAVSATATPPPAPSPTLPAPSATPAGPTATSAPNDPADAAAIAQIESGKALLVESGKLMPFYRAQRELRSYQTINWTYIIDVQTHQIVEVLPVHETAAGEGGSLSPAELEQAARQFIAKAAPGTTFDGLRPNHSSQTTNFLFRWEDHTAHVMEDGFTYPYIQVALNASGQMLNYFNTLVFNQ
jgi:hypothetical protein